MAKDKRDGGGTRGGVNQDALALQKKVEEKQKKIAAGELSQPQKKEKDKPKSMVNPHTGKHDPEWTKKMLAKEGKQ